MEVGASITQTEGGQEEAAPSSKTETHWPRRKRQNEDI